MGPSALHSEVAAADRAPHRGPLKRHFGSHFTKAIIPSLNATSSSGLQNSCLGPPTCTPLGQALRFTGRDPWVYGALGATNRVPTSREPPRGKATLKGKCRVPSAGPRCPALHGMEGPGLSSSQPPLAHPPPSLRPHSHRPPHRPGQVEQVASYSPDWTGTPWPPARLVVLCKAPPRPGALGVPVGPSQSAPPFATAHFPTAQGRHAHSHREGGSAGKGNPQGVGKPL